MLNPILRAITFVLCAFIPRTAGTFYYPVDRTPEVSSYYFNRFVQLVFSLKSTYQQLLLFFPENVSPTLHNAPFYPGCAAQFPEGYQS